MENIRVFSSAKNKTHKNYFILKIQIQIYHFGSLSLISQKKIQKVKDHLETSVQKFLKSFSKIISLK